MPIISTHELVKTYSLGEVKVRALRGISIEIQAGEFLSVIGPSGSGKSTFMHILGCLDRPTSGQYVLEGKDVSKLSKNELAAIRNRQIGFVFQGFNLLTRTSALDNVELPLLYDGSGMKGAERRQRSQDALKEVGLADRANHHPNQLSGGQQQRVAIALMESFQALNAERGITILLITHEQAIAEYASRIVGFRDGRIVADHQTETRRIARDEMTALPPDVDVEPGHQPSETTNIGA